MALVIEDGTIVAGANSYVDVAEAKAYATARGVDLGADDALIERRLLEAMDYLESLRYKGSPTDPETQVLSWPRCGVYYDSRTIASGVIPDRLKNAQSQLVIELTNGVVLWANVSASDGSAKFVKREKVDVIETEFATPQEMAGQGAVLTATLTTVTTLLSPLLKAAMQLKAYRG